MSMDYGIKFLSFYERNIFVLNMYNINRLKENPLNNTHKLHRHCVSVKVHKHPTYAAHLDLRSWAAVTLH